MVFVYSAALIQASKCFAQIIRHALLCRKLKGHVGRFAGVAHFLAEVCVQQNRTAEALYGQTLPVKRKVL